MTAVEIDSGAFDWRGVPIKIGDTVIYGSGVGRSIQLNEGVIESFGTDIDRSNKNNHRRVNVRIIRRSYSDGVKPIVSVGEDRLTIVTELPPTTNLTQEEENEIRRIAYEKSEANEASHALKIVYQDYGFAFNRFVDYSKTHCVVCGLVGYRELRENNCAGKPNAS